MAFEMIVAHKPFIIQAMRMKKQQHAFNSSWRMGRCMTEGKKEKWKKIEILFESTIVCSAN